MSSFKQYLGDDVHADYDGMNIVLTVEDVHNIHARITIKEEVLEALNQYDQWVKATLLLPKLNDTTGSQES